MSVTGLLSGRDAFRTIHVGALALCAVMLPWSTAILSMAQMLLVVNWLTEGVVRKDFIGRFRRTFTSAPALIFLSIFFLHVLGLLWTTDLDWGMDLVRILLPVLSLGAVLAGSTRLTPAEFRAVILLGAWSTVVSTFVCLLLRTGGDYRSLSVFISHIRLTLLLCLSVVVLIMDSGGPKWLRIAGYCVIPWALVFINKLGSIQGFFILLILAMVFAWRWVGGRSSGQRIGVRGALLMLPLLAVVLGILEVRKRYQLPDPGILELMEHSAGGELYTHDLKNPQTENGTHVWTYTAWGELRSTWRLRSKYRFDAPDDKGHPISGTLVRYLASKGQRKDSVAVMALTEGEVRAIEQGIPNAHQGQRSALRERVEEVFFELEHYYAYGEADGHSVAMRLEFLKAGTAIAAHEWLMGVGTGDTKDAFAEQYERMRSKLSEAWRHRAHNEYLTLWISFGVFGLLWCIFAFWWPAERTGAWREPLFIAWAIIFIISCFTDDTIETQAGATFFGLYYALFVFAAPRTISTTGQA